MYYHRRNLKYIEYGKVYPAPLEAVDFMLPAYKWLGKYCGYCPQVWLSRSRSDITGKRNKIKRKQSKIFGKKTNNEGWILFGFDIIKGFPVDYDMWCFLLNGLLGGDSLKTYFERHIKWCKEEKEDPLNDPELRKWINSSSEENFLNRYLFVENDQVVVPSLNLKSAKRIVCKNEKEVKILRKMGFINDRIRIQNDKLREY